MDKLLLRALSPSSCSLGLRAQPGARHAGVTGLWNGRLKIAVRAPADDGRANHELIELLANLLCVPKNSLLLISGEKQRLKQVSLPLSVEEARQRLTAHLEQP